ncbi:uroporphyrinogen-III C-methyltransferase [Ruficoccus sp. ZRK36]|uniref:uroporphyrinogen-III C-methyltransferase n=1 Tax=Ruficoccus sp. ZRK36 TaxID=2866311 RepID=UPI001C736661|nr:uroporphyrinogen-III C-methyltransferase [Ruficoccus sp. ZRK36]QYY34957.1 uroporphyrinogen-III C-methyltransferase [Ruficoccus sp. ZRK36]
MSEGKVFLVGAGPGDPGLVTVRARELIETCDVLVYDYLANAELQSWVKADCELVYVGKRPGRHSIPQDKIEDILVKHANEGKQVVRLKGGDPFVFGRGGEEACRLHADGIEFEIVPAVTAALGAAACAGIPLTHREHSSSVCFLTGHEDMERGNMHVDFAKAAQLGGTLCIYMGMGHISEITDKLIAGGLPPETPVAVIEWATLPRQRSLCATLATVAEAKKKAGLKPPAIVIVGEVARYYGELNWFERRPLSGKRIAITRSREQAGELRGKLEALGAEVLSLPLIKITEAESHETVDVFDGMAHYDWVVFTSPNGARFFFKKFFEKFADLRSIGGVRIACIGESTAREVKSQHLAVDVIPETAVAESLAEALLTEQSLDSVNMLVVTGNRNRDVLIKRLEEEGHAIVDVLPVYTNEPSDMSEEPDAESFRQRGADAITFTSASTVENFVAQSGQLQLAKGATRPKAISIGPITSAAMKEKGVPIDAEAKESSIDALVAAIVKKLV